jgi:hypothetical protein
MNANLVITPSAEPVVSVAAEARARRDQLLTEAGTVTTITDRLDADAALPVLRELKAFLTEVEDQRESVKAPVLNVGRKIDALAKELVADLKAQENRIARALGAFEAEERRKAEDARRAADAEAARIAYEAACATRKAVIAAPTPEAAARASDDISGKARTEIATVKAAAITAPKPAASQLRSEICFEVTDIKALYVAEPNLVTLEPNGTAIRAILRANPDLKVPGLRHWTEQKLNLR